jgi:hypothetical protein
MADYKAVYKECLYQGLKKGGLQWWSTLMMVVIKKYFLLRQMKGFPMSCLKEV